MDPDQTAPLFAEMTFKITGDKADDDCCDWQFKG